MNLEIGKTEIIDLHREVIENLKLTLSKGIRIGELLCDIKERLPHGEYAQWIKNNMPFTDRTARNYMSLFLRRDELKSETVSVLDAYKQLRASACLDIDPIRKGQAKDTETFQKLLNDTDEAITNNDPERLKNIIDKLEMLGNKVAERKIRIMRRLGVLLNELQTLKGENKTVNETNEND